MLLQGGAGWAEAAAGIASTAAPAMVKLAMSTQSTLELNTGTSPCEGNGTYFRINRLACRMRHTDQRIPSPALHQSNSAPLGPAVTFGAVGREW